MVHRAGGETKKIGVMARLVIFLVVVLIVAIGTMVTLVLIERKREAALRVPPPPTQEELKAERERLAEEAEQTATWETFHCNLLHRYYQGAETSVPIAELIGIAPDADPDLIEDRCVGLLPAVKRMGGWPNGRPAMDNFVVCEGFEFVLRGTSAIRVAPTREDLAAGKVVYSFPGGQSFTQDLVDGQAVRLGQYVPLVTAADDRCVIVGSLRYGRKRHISGSIVRAGP